MLQTIVLIILLLILVGAMPPIGWVPHNYGYAPPSLGLVLWIILFLWLLGRL